MVKRIFFGLLLIAFICAVFCLDWWVGHTSKWRLVGGELLASVPLALLVACLIIAGYVEFRRLMKAVGIQMPLVTGMLCCLVLGTTPVWTPILAFVGCFRDYRFLLYSEMVLLGLILGVLFFEQLALHRLQDLIRRLGATFLAVGYLGVCAYLVLAVREWHGLGAFILFVACVKFSDMGAFFTGKFLGRHKLIEWLSPKKTWEGLLGGMVASAVVAVAVSYVLNKSFAAAVIFGLAMGLLGQGADLCESALKRAAGLKDAGAVVPEFGGVLDILDSLLLSAPAALVLLELLQPLR